MANGIIKTDLLSQPARWANSVEFTPTNGETVGSIGCRYMKLSNCLAWIYIDVKFTTPPTHVLLFTLPSDVRPIGMAFIPVDGGESYNAKAQCTISNTGDIYVTSVDKYVSGSGLFLITS